MNNLEIFDTKKSIERFNEIEMKEIPFYFLCKKCKKIPNIFLKDYQNLIINCENCGKKTNEKIENVVNYNSKWISNEIIKFCSIKHEKKILSIIFCKTCNLFLCEDCLNEHKKNDSNHNLIELNKLKLNFCNFHNENLTNFCFNCNEEICEECLKNEHNKHKTQKIENAIKNKNLENFNKFLEIAENSLKNKYEYLNKNIVNLQNNDEDSKEKINRITQNIFEYFFDNLKIEQNLLFLAKILFISSEKIKEFTNDIKKQYDNFIKNIQDYFENKILFNFEQFILIEKEKEEEEKKFVEIKNNINIRQYNLRKKNMKMTIKKKVII